MDAQANTLSAGILLFLIMDPPAHSITMMDIVGYSAHIAGFCRMSAWTSKTMDIEPFRLIVMSIAGARA